VELAIIAAAGPDEHYGLPGVGRKKRRWQRCIDLGKVKIMNMAPDPAFEVEKKSQWFKRGWTF